MCTAQNPGQKGLVDPPSESGEQLLRRIFAIAAAWMSLALTGSYASAAALSPEQFASLSKTCAPSVPYAVLRRVSEVESQFDPLALYDNTRRISIHPASAAAAMKQSQQWLARGDSIDIGLMQINSSILSALGMTVETALNPCRSLQASALILSEAYAKGASAADRQAALLIALSRFNTGRALDGLTNGYVGRVLSAQGASNTINSKPSDLADPQQANWDVWAAASTAQHDGAAWLIGSQDTHDFLIGAGAQPITGEPHALSSQGPGTAPGT